MPELTPEIERELAALDDALAGRRVAPDLTELGELALLLRDERPQPNDGFARHLDHRAARGFPKGDPRQRLSGRRWLAWHEWMGPGLAGALAVGIVAIVLVAGRGGDDADSGGEGSSGAVALSQSESAREDSAGAGADAAGGSGAGQESSS